MSGIFYFSDLLLIIAINQSKKFYKGECQVGDFFSLSTLFQCLYLKFRSRASVDCIWSSTVDLPLRIVDSDFIWNHD